MDIYTNAFPMLMHLTMGRMKYDWSTIMQCCKAFPSIQELIVSYNIIETISGVEESLNIMKLTELSLEHNLISNWNEVLKLGILPWLVKIIKIIFLLRPFLIF